MPDNISANELGGVETPPAPYDEHAEADFVADQEAQWNEKVKALQTAEDLDRDPVVVRRSR